MTNDLFTNYHCIFKIKVKEKVFQFIPKTIFQTKPKECFRLQMRNRSLREQSGFPAERGLSACPRCKLPSGLSSSAGRPTKRRRWPTGTCSTNKPKLEATNVNTKVDLYSNSSFWAIYLIKLHARYLLRFPKCATIKVILIPTHTTDQINRFNFLIDFS